jgi:predicted ATP-binding protein involved in virulence
MKIEEVEITNFRAIQKVRINFDGVVNVIVGPNAVGKTTILEAIRLVKAILAPRTPNETSQALISAGASSPHIPQQINVAAIARDIDKPVQIIVRFKLEDQEIQALGQNIPRIALQIVQAQIGQSFSNQALLVGYLNSDQGKRQISEANQNVEHAFTRMSVNKICTLGVTFSNLNSQIISENQFDQWFFTFLEQNLSPFKTVFSYFPADRAIPIGDPGIQIGGGDIGNQLESHNSQPQLKYARLKNTIFNAQLMDDGSKEEMNETFKSLFEKILKDKSLKSISVSPFGLISIQIEDKKTQRVFEIDGLSSGEKGLILTFLTISRSVFQNGIVLLDEPELHLNPAVCRQVLDFILREFGIKKNIQFILCTHSPEILSATINSESCSLYHLISDERATKVRYKDQSELTDALRKLGASEADALLYQGTVFVEGVDDEELLVTGFPERMKRFKVKDLGGRIEIEKNIKLIQDQESAGSDVGRQIFIFDLDSKPSSLQSKGSVEVLQWQKTNLENYLIDEEAIFDLVKNEKKSKINPSTISEVSDILKELAMSQIDEFSSRLAFRNFQYGNLQFEKSDFANNSIDAVSDLLFARVSNVRLRIGELSFTEWKIKFLAEREKIAVDTKIDWEPSWKIRCDGKKLLADLQQKIGLKISLRQFKAEVMQKMREDKRPNWRELDSLLSSAIH